MPQKKILFGSRQLDKSLTDRFWEMKHGLQRSYYYYESRRCFWVLFLSSTKILEFWFGLPAAKALINAERGFVLWAASLISTASFALTLWQAAPRIKTLGQQMRIMRECLGMIPYREKDETEKLYREIKRKRERAERKDDVVFEVVDAMCYNKACKTLGATERCKLHPVQKFFGWWLPVSYTANAQIEFAGNAADGDAKISVREKDVPSGSGDIIVRPGVF